MNVIWIVLLFSAPGLAPHSVQKSREHISKPRRDAHHNHVRVAKAFSNTRMYKKTKHVKSNHSAFLVRARINKLKKSIGDIAPQNTEQAVLTVILAAIRAEYKDNGSAITRVLIDSDSVTFPGGKDELDAALREVHVSAADRIRIFEMPKEGIEGHTYEAVEIAKRTASAHLKQVH